MIWICSEPGQVAEVVSTTEYQLRLRDLQATEAREAAASLATETSARLQAGLDSLHKASLHLSRTLSPSFIIEKSSSRRESPPPPPPPPRHPTIIQPHLSSAHFLLE